MPLSPYLSLPVTVPTHRLLSTCTLGAELLYKISFRRNAKISAGQSEIPPFRNAIFPIPPSPTPVLRIAGSDIMMSDAIPSGKASYSGFTLVLDSQQVEEGKRWFDNLARQRKNRNGTAGNFLGAWLRQSHR